MTKNNVMAIIYAAAIVLNNRQGQAHVELDDSCVKSELGQEIFSPISLFIGVA